MDLDKSQIPFPTVRFIKEKHKPRIFKNQRLGIMEFKVIEETKNKLVFQLPGETHTLCNTLKHELQMVKGVTIATYRIDHPLVGVPQFYIETKGEEPRKALKSALASLKKKAAEFKKEAGSL